MSMDAKKSMGWTMVLILLGMAALFGGSKWLGLLIPAAMLVWYTAKPSLELAGIDGRVDNRSMPFLGRGIRYGI